MYQELTARGIKVGNTPGVIAGAVADLAFGLVIASARRLCEGDRLTRRPDFSAIDVFWFGAEVHGTQLGIVGMGSVGQEVARRASGFDMRIAYFQRRRHDDEVRSPLLGRCV